MPAPGPYNSPHILPVPAAQGTPYGGSEQQPVNFWNSSLPEDDVVCAVDFANVTDSCCPFAIGIRADNVQGCRMKNTTQNVAFFENCTRQTWGEVTNRPQDAVPFCVPFLDKVRNQEEVTHVDQRGTKGDGLICGTVGNLSRPFDYTSGSATGA